MTPVPNLEQLYDDHACRLFAWVLQLTRDEDLTRDVLQELFVRMARQPDIVARARDPRALLLTMARRLAIDFIRRRTTRHRREVAAGPEPAVIFASVSDPDQASFLAALDEALRQLPEEQREVVHLKLWEQRTFAEIAAILGIPANTAASRYRYAIDKLQTHLRPLYEEIRSP